MRRNEPSRRPLKKRKPRAKAIEANHVESLPRLKRIRGQLDGIERMIQDRRYCVEILQQIKAVTSALKAFEMAILKAHLKGCVSSALASTDPLSTEKKIQEIMDLLSR